MTLALRNQLLKDPHHCRQRRLVVTKRERFVKFLATEGICTPNSRRGPRISGGPVARPVRHRPHAPYVVAPAHGFWLLDNDLVMVETFSAELNLAQPLEISLYRGIFDALVAVASYGRAARTIINRVVDDLAPELPEHPE